MNNKSKLIEVQKLNQNPCEFDQCPFKAEFNIDDHFFCFVHIGEYQNIIQGRQPDDFNDQ